MQGSASQQQLTRASLLGKLRHAVAYCDARGRGLLAASRKEKRHNIDGYITSLQEADAYLDAGNLLNAAFNKLEEQDGN